MGYQQLTEGKRYQISILRARGCSPTDIAKQIQVHRSTVYRELRRNRRGNEYCSQVAHQLTLRRRKTARKRRISSLTVQFVEMTLGWQWSPEQISGVGQLIELPVSHEWIYRYIAADKARGGKLYKSLRQGHKRYRKGRNSKRPIIPDPRPIDERPAIVDTRERFGDSTGRWIPCWARPERALS